MAKVGGQGPALVGGCWWLLVKKPLIKPLRSPWSGLVAEECQDTSVTPLKGTPRLTESWGFSRNGIPHWQFQWVEHVMTIIFYLGSPQI